MHACAPARAVGARRRARAAHRFARMRGAQGARAPRSAGCARARAPRPRSRGRITIADQSNGHHSQPGLTHFYGFGRLWTTPARCFANFGRFRRFRPKLARLTNLGRFLPNLAQDGPNFDVQGKFNQMSVQHRVYIAPALGRNRPKCTNSCHSRAREALIAHRVPCVFSWVTFPPLPADTPGGGALSSALSRSHRVSWDFALGEPQRRSGCHFRRAPMQKPWGVARSLGLPPTAPGGGC